MILPEWLMPLRKQKRYVCIFNPCSELRVYGLGTLVRGGRSCLYALARQVSASVKQVSKKTQDEMVNMSMGLRVFMTETEEKLNSKADAKALLQKAGWTEVRDLMGELSAHLSEKLHQSSSTFKGLNEKISNMDCNQSVSGSVKCISCARLIAPSPSRSAAIWSKNPLDPELSGGAEEHVHRMKIASAHLYIADKMPAIESAQKGSVFCLFFGVPPGCGAAAFLHSVSLMMIMDLFL